MKAYCFLLCACMIFPRCFVPRVHAQEGRDTDSLKIYDINEIVVTGTRTYSKIIDVPYSIERIDNSEFRFDRKASLDDVVGSVPGLFFQNRYGNHDVRISIRGFGSRSNSGIRGVRILLDGIPESEPDGQTRIEAIDFQSVGSIEIVKGNASSLYTNAPGGVINFINDIRFQQSMAVNFNQFGSFGYRSNGIKTGVRTDKYAFLLTYNYHNGGGYREHSKDYWHIVNSVLESKPGDHSTLSVYSYYVSGLIQLPGSLTKAALDADPLQANPRDLGRDAKRITRKGRVGLQFGTSFGEDRENYVEVTGYGTIKYFERTAGTYRIIDRSGIGGSARFVHYGRLGGRKNEFSVGSDLLYQSGPVVEYDNIGGMKGDILDGITDEVIGNVGFYFQDRFNLAEDQLDLLLTGRYDKVAFDTKNQIFQAQNADRSFEAFTPKAALNFKITPTVAAYTSYGLSFDSPAANELENYPTSSKPTSILNPDLEPQKSRNFEIGVKGNLLFADLPVLRVVSFELTGFNSRIEDEIVPFEVFGDVFFRNAAKTDRTGIEAGVSADIVKGVRLKTAYTFSHFSYDAYDARAIIVDTLGNVVASEMSFAGNSVPSVPEHNLSMSLTYEHPLTETITSFLKGTYLHVSGMYVDDANSDKTRGYDLINTSAGLDMTFGNFNLIVSGGVNNIADKRYVGFVNINSAAGEFYEAGEPRNFFAGANFGYTF